MNGITQIKDADTFKRLIKCKTQLVLTLRYLIKFVAILWFYKEIQHILGPKAFPHPTIPSLYMCPQFLDQILSLFARCPS